jgi:hypothetical protein
VGGIVVGSELIHRGLRRKLKEVKEKIMRTIQKILKQIIEQKKQEAEYHRD